MSKNVRRNRKREPGIRQIDRKGWVSLVLLLLKIVLIAAIAAGIPLGAYAYYRHLVADGYFHPNTVTVRGNVQVDDASILDASGLEAADVNLFEANVRSMEAGIETLPWVKKARVVIHLPDTVEITVTEHQPLGIVHDNANGAGGLSIVDADGRYIKPWTPEDPVFSPLVTIERKIVRSEPDGRGSREAVEAFRLAEMVAKSGYIHKIQEVYYEDATGFTLYTDTTEIRMGYDNFGPRVERLLEVDGVLASRGITASYILLDGDGPLDRIAVKPAPGPSPGTTE